MIRPRCLSFALMACLAMSSCGVAPTGPDLGRADTLPRASLPAPDPTTQPTPPVATTAAPTVPPSLAADTTLAVGPQDLAARLAAAESITRAGPIGDDAVIAHAFVTQILYRQLARTPEWDAAVLAAVPPAFQLAVTENVAARRQFQAMHTRLSDTLPAWRIVDPVPVDELLGHYRDAEAAFGVPWEILAGVNLVETGLGRIRGTSTAGAQGPMQFLPATWAAFGDGGDIDDTRDAIMGAARYLAHNGGGSGNIDSALWNYNHSEHYVEGVKHYAAVLTDDPAAFNAYYHWQIIYLSTVGDVWLARGYETDAKIPAADYIAARPDRLVG